MPGKIISEVTVGGDNNSAIVNTIGSGTSSVVVDADGKRTVIVNGKRVDTDDKTNDRK